MSVADNVAQGMAGLPIGQQLEVLHFVEFLKHKQEDQTGLRDPEGILADQAFDLSYEDFVEARREMWRNFPRVAPMTALLLDTNALIWYLQKSARLSHSAHSAIKSCIQSGSRAYVSAISLAEVVYLEEKLRVPAGILKRILAELAIPRSFLTETPFTISIAASMASVPRDIVPDMPDRMIAATALHPGVPLVTADRRIRAANLNTIW